MRQTPCWATEAAGSALSSLRSPRCRHGPYFEAACEVKKKGINVKPEVMIPLVGNVNELKLQKDLVVKVAEEVFKKNKTKIDYMVGTMIEIPRAAITADEIATEAEFFSFGTNDLTQMTLGMSRDDAGKFLQYPMWRKRSMPLTPSRGSMKAVWANS